MELEYNVQYLVGNSNNQDYYILGDGRFTTIFSPKIFLTPVQIKHFSEYRDVVFREYRDVRVIKLILNLTSKYIKEKDKVFGYVLYNKMSNRFKYKNEETYLIELADWYKIRPKSYNFNYTILSVLF